jgi:hypothetical protein
LQKRKKKYKKCFTVAGAFQPCIGHLPFFHDTGFLWHVQYYTSSYLNSRALLLSRDHNSFRKITWLLPLVNFLQSHVKTVYWHYQIVKNPMLWKFGWIFFLSHF